jgi:hypothetical protein
VRAAGVRQLGAAVETLELPAPRALRSDEVLIEVQASGVGNWDEFARTGGWDLGARPPLALGVEAAGLVVATGDRVAGVSAGDRVTAVRDGGRLATITSDLPAAERGIAMTAVLVAPDGSRLAGLVQLLAQRVLTVSLGGQFPLGQAAAALSQARHGAHGSAIVLLPGER